MPTKSGQSTQANGRVDQDRKDRRRRAGAYIKACREAAGLSQKNLGDAMGYEYYTTISQIERGVTVLPLDLMVPMAKALGTDVFAFVNTIFKLYHPEIQVVYERELRQARAEALDIQPEDGYTHVP